MFINIRMKKVSITGHTKGIGNALLKVFEKNDFLVEGFSRTNGYDISNPLSRKEIISKSLDSDIFINNAFDHEGQISLLKEIVDQWKNTNKLIIHIGTKGIYIPVKTPHENYLNSKREQQEYIISRFFKGSPRILNVKAGLIDTDINKQYDVEKLDVDAFAEMIYLLATSKVGVQEVMIDISGADWEQLFWKD